MAEEKMPTPKRLVVTKRPPSFSKEQKVGLGLFFGIGGMAVLLGLVYISRHLTTPFVIEYEGEPILAGADFAAAQLEELQKKDTDGDGLSDYLELYAYGTSPYLEDTDGDGDPDRAELEAGTDPNCIKGQTCSTGALDETEVADQHLDNFLGESYEDAPNPNDYSSGFSEDAINEIVDPIGYVIENTSTEDMRTLFAESGVEESVLTQLSDEEVRTMFEEMLLEMQASGELEALLNAE